MRSLGCVIFTFFLTACGLSSSHKPSILVVAVEGLSADQFFCGDTSGEFDGGLSVFCEEGVRYTHAFTPSTLSQASMVAMLTGQYPTSTGVVHNGAQYLSEEFLTVAEVAFLHGYRTSFYTGGAPIWSKSGLDQGFEVFDDNVRANFKRPYRPASENFQLFLQWVRELEPQSAFMSVIFLPDLQFGQYATTDEFGQQRSFGRESQLKEINESFEVAVQNLKQLKRWDNTYVIFVGVNGASDVSREGDILTTNLHGESTQTLLLIKPARKARDLGLSWSIDENVSLVDIGETLFDILGLSNESASRNSDLPVISLKSSLERPQVNWPSERFVLVESAWASWRGFSNSRFSLRQGQLLYIHDLQPKLFNTLTDRFEIQSFNAKEMRVLPAYEKMKEFFDKQGLEPATPISSSVVQKIKLYSELMRPSKISRDEIKMRLVHLIKQRPWDKQLIGWLARYAVAEKDWVLLDEIGREHMYPLWVYVARRMKGEEIEMPNHRCWSLLDQQNYLNSKLREACDDDEFIALLRYKFSSQESGRAGTEEKLIRKYFLAETREVLSSLSLQNGMSWDLDTESPSEPRLLQLALLLPEYKSIRALLESATKRL